MYISILWWNEGTTMTRGKEIVAICAGRRRFIRIIKGAF